MRGERRLRRAHPPDVEIVDVDDVRKTAQESLHRFDLDVLGNALHRKVE